MNPLFISEEDVVHFAPMADAIETLDAAFRDQEAGRARNEPRQRLKMPGTTLHILPASVPGYFGYKAYTSSAAGARFLMYLFDARSTEMVAILQADALGQIRTGAASGLATRLMSLNGASEAVLFGAGRQAQSQLAAIDAVRRLENVWVVNRREDRRTAFIETMQPRVRARLRAAESAGDAVRRSQIVTTITTSREPVLRGEWLQPGQHINAAGGNLLLRRELDDEAVQRATVLVVDSLDQAKRECGEFTGAMESGRRHWDEVMELKSVVAGTIPSRRTDGDITLFKSLGIGLEDVALARLVYERAVAAGRGRRLPM